MDESKKKFEVPNAYKGKEKIKLIVLGCDPTNNNNIKFNTVFNLDKNRKYFGIIGKNLSKILNMKDNKEKVMDYIYVQNLYKGYLDKETGKYKKKEWSDLVKDSVEPLSEELDLVTNNDKSIPVALTSEYLLLPLLKEQYLKEYKRFSNIYRDKKIIGKHENMLGRNLIALSRCRVYCSKEYDDYYKFIGEFLKENS